MLLGHRNRMRIEKMSDCTVAANQNKLLESWADAALFKQPEQAFDSDIHGVVWGFLAGGAVQNVRNAIQRTTYGVAVGDAALDHFQPFLCRQYPVVAQSAENYVLMRCGLSDAIHKMGAHFAGSASDKDAGIRGWHLDVFVSG